MYLVQIEIAGNVYKQFGPYKHGADAAGTLAELQSAYTVTKDAVPNVGALNVEITIEDLPVENYRPTLSVSDFCTELRYLAKNLAKS